MCRGEDEIRFIYNNADGIRTSKTVNGVEHIYTLSGTKILTESWGNNLIIYLYDETNSPIGFMYRNSSYAMEKYDVYVYEKNLQGDILAVYDTSGTKLIAYLYDAWGNVRTAYFKSGAVRSSKYNPFKYMGYYHDSETGLYYLNSRYYDPATGRFISPDSTSYLGADGGLKGYNLYAYCSNNPVSYCDPEGHFAISLTMLGFIIGATIGATVGGITAYNIAKNHGAEGWELFGWTMAGIVGGGIVGGSLGAGIGAVATKFTGVIGLSITKYSVLPVRAVTVLGHMPGYIGAAQATGSGFYLVADVIYNKMVQEGVEWINNMTYIKDANTLGSAFVLSPDRVVNAASTFWKEIQYLVEHSIPWIMP